MNYLDLATRNVDRLHTTRHAWMMYGLVRWLQPINIVEVGAWAGFCTMHLAQACEDNGFGHVTVIDDYSLGKVASEIHNNLQLLRLTERVSLLSGKSTEVKWPARVDFAFIDGDHSFDGCLHDCNRAIELGAKCVCVHDTAGWWGPQDYVDMFREQSAGVWDMIDQPFDSGFAVMVQRQPRPPLLYTEKDYPEGHV